MNRLLLILTAIQITHTLYSQAPPPKRELRGAWVTTFYNSDWPNRTQTPTQQQANFISIADHHKATGINVLYVQMRSQCDAMYTSSIEPWSVDLNGMQGRAPSPLWDPMQFTIEETHKRGMEFHAWLNPYRAVSNVASLPSFAPTHIAKTHPEWMLKVGTILILNPGLQEVRNYVTSIAVDILKRYDVDGIHFDDYFYPSGIINDDSAFMLNPRGFTDRGDWRRDNVNLLIKRIYDSVKSIKPWVKFGVSPTGIYRNSTNPDIGTPTAGQEHYSALYADTKKWLQQGWVDYIAPQVYWYIGQPNANYAVIVPWWNANANGRHIYIGMAGYKVNDPASGINWANPSQIPNEMRINRSYPNIYGQSIYNTSSLRSTARLGFRDSLQKFFYQKPALLPTMPWRDSVPPQPATALNVIKWGNDSVVLKWTKPPTPTNELDKAKKFVIYRSTKATIDTADANNILAITNTSTDTFVDTTILANTTYYYTVTALDQFHNESTLSNIASNTPPSINCLHTQVIYNGHRAAVLPDYTEWATINNGIPTAFPMTLKQVPAPKTVLKSGIVIVTLTATDIGGNSNSCSFVVRVAPEITNNFKILDDDQLKITILQNPTQSQFTLTTKSSSNKLLNITILNDVGQMVEQKNGIAPNGSVYVGGTYQPGIYYIQVIQGGTRQTFKLIKMAR